MTTMPSARRRRSPRKKPTGKTATTRSRLGCAQLLQRKRRLQRRYWLLDMTLSRLRARKNTALNSEDDNVFAKGVEYRNLETLLRNGRATLDI
jgi:hypothetical protein